MNGASSLKFGLKVHVTLNVGSTSLDAREEKRRHAAHVAETERYRIIWKTTRDLTMLSTPRGERMKRGCTEA